MLVRGLQQRSRHLEASGALIGFGAALHGFGVLSMAGAWLAALGTRVRFPDRSGLFLRCAVWSVAMYLGWIAVYEVILKLPVVPGHAESILLRPWLIDRVGERINAAILSRTGARDLFFTAWVVGMPLLAVAISLARRYGEQARAVLLYTVPSVIFVVVFWPVQGLGVDVDLVFAAFPAVYALAWLCAHERRHAAVAAVLLASAHLAFWWIVLGRV